MSIVAEMPDSDSGVASPEVAPEDQIPMDKIEADKDVKVEEIEEEDKKITPYQAPIQEDGDELQEDDDIDESLVERLIGLSEMFPDSIRSVSSKVTKGTVALINGTYQLSRQIVWVGVTTSIILIAPVMFELERHNVEEMVKQDRNRLVLGPGTAMSGGGMPAR